MKRVGVLIAAGTLLWAASTTLIGSATQPSIRARAVVPSHHVVAPPEWVVRVGTGPARRHFILHEPAGTIRLLQITASRGTDVSFTGEIPHLAAVGIATGQPADCQPHGVRETCTQPEEACPMPIADWHFQMAKRAGRPGRIILRFAIEGPVAR